MTSLTPLCLTCLSNLDEGARLPDTLQNFLCDVLHFKTELLQESSKIICRKCYKTLIEVKCFYTQLRDVEVYLESKSQINNELNEPDEAEEPYISQLECTVSIGDDSKLDPIVIDEDEECCVVENKNAVKENRKSDVATGKRFVCLTCSKLFSLYEDLRSHEKTHLQNPSPKASPVFLPANSPQQVITCPECKQEFYSKLNLEAHMKKHKRIRPFYCVNCKHRFEKKEQLVVHESKYKCVICCSKCCSRNALDAHMKEKHSGNLNDSQSLGVFESVDIKPSIDHQHCSNKQ